MFACGVFAGLVSSASEKRVALKAIRRKKKAVIVGRRNIVMITKYVFLGSNASYLREFIFETSLRILYSAASLESVKLFLNYFFVAAVVNVAEFQEDQSEDWGRVLRGLESRVGPKII